MANYILQELPEEMSDGKKVLYPKMQLYTRHDYEAVMEHMKVYAGNFSEGTMRAVFDAFPRQDLVVMAAAVADYRPVEISEQKIKKQPGDFVLRLERTTDILAELGKRKRPGQILAGFAAESENLICRDRQNGPPVVITSVWSSWEKGRTLSSVREESSSVTSSDMQDPKPDKTYSVGASTAAGRDSYIVGVTSWGPDGIKGTWDDITTMPEEIVKAPVRSPCKSQSSMRPREPPSRVSIYFLPLMSVAPPPTEIVPSAVSELFTTVMVLSKSVAFSASL